VPGINKGRIPIKWLNSQSNHHISRFEVEREHSLVGRGIANNSISQEGLFVKRGEGDSNPCVLSDMGLAIPRPTRLLPALAGLGDPRNSLFGSVSCIRLSLIR
jgi:hypothetical protein